MGQTPSSDVRDPLTEAERIDLVGASKGADEAAYTWDLATGAIEWESNAASIIDVNDLNKIATGAAYHALIVPEHLSDRLEVFSRTSEDDRARGIPYRLHYRLNPGGLRSRKTVSVEDYGYWWPGPDGHPIRARGVIRRLHERDIEQQRLLVRNDLDELTGQLNRIRLTEALGTVLSRSERECSPHGFLILAVNNMPVINDTFGVETGDQVIAEVARRTRSRMRGGDIFGRYSSNKFGIVVMNCGRDALRKAADRFVKVIREETIKTTAGQLAVTISIGGVVVPDQANALQDAINFALRALDSAQSKRVDCAVLYEPESDGDSARVRNKTIADSVVSALDENRMRLVLQPIISAATGKPAMYECLLRMQSRDGQLVAAGEFVPIAEQLGLARLIDRRTLEMTVELLKKHPEVVLSVNVSGLTCADQEWLTALQRLTEGRKSLLSRIIVEITETAAIQDLDQSITFVDTLKELGCRVAIDDFGAGYTSFKNLKLLNVDIVKIDGIFVKNLADDTSDQIFIKTMVDLARTFGMETVAEWVSDEHSVKYLMDVGITYLQGYYYGMPIDAEAYKSPDSDLTEQSRQLRPRL